VNPSVHHIANTS